MDPAGGAAGGGSGWWVFIRVAGLWAAGAGVLIAGAGVGCAGVERDGAGRGAEEADWAGGAGSAGSAEFEPLGPGSALPGPGERWPPRGAELGPLRDLDASAAYAAARSDLAVTGQAWLDRRTVRYGLASLRDERGELVVRLPAGWEGSAGPVEPTGAWASVGRFGDAGTERRVVRDFFARVRALGRSGGASAWEE